MKWGSISAMVLLGCAFYLQFAGEQGWALLMALAAVVSSVLSHHED